MANEQVISNAVSMLLNVGTDSSGEIVTKAVSIGTLNTNPSTFDADKALAIASAITQCLSHPLYRTQRTAKSYITANV